MSNQVQAVDFHGDTLITLEHDGEHYVAVRPIVENMGLDWSGQQKKLTESEKFNCRHISTVAKDGKTRKVLCMPVKKLNGWLFSINPEKVRPEIRHIVEQYQEECFTVLHDYWHNGVAINPRKTTVTDRKPLVQAVNLLVKQSDLDYRTVHKMVHQYMGVDSIEDITLQDIPKAVEYVHRLICDLSKLDEEQLLYNEMWRQMGIMRQAEVRKELVQLKSEMRQLFERLETATKLNSIIYDAFVQPIRPTLTQEQRDIAIQRAIEGLERSRLLLRLI